MNITTSQNYLSFPRGKSFLKQMLFHNQHTKSALDLVVQFFLKMMLGRHVRVEGQKNPRMGGIYHG